MPTPVAAARQCLTPDAARALDEAVSVARRRGHAQTTSLHAVSALLSLPSSPLLRDACSRARNCAYSPRLQFKALDLCLSVSLDRAPSSHNHSSADHDPPVSNSLMAAIKRSQANQRRHPDNFHFSQGSYSPLDRGCQKQQQQQQPFSVSSVKVELQHLILSILDDPVVSRVFAEAGFRSSDIKLAILRPLRPRGSPIFLCNLSESPRRFPFFFGCGDEDGGGENFRRIGEVLVRSRGKNPLLLGACANDALRGFAEAVEKRREGALPVELLGLRVVCIAEEVAGGDAEVVGRRVREIGNLAEQCVGPGVVCGERCEHEVLAASKERFCASSAADPHQSSLPPWLQIAEFGSTKGLNVKGENSNKLDLRSSYGQRTKVMSKLDWGNGPILQTKDNGVLLDSSESGPLHKNLDKLSQHLLHQDANTFPTVVGFHCGAEKKKEDVDNCRSKSPSEYINLNSHVPVGMQMMPTSQSSSPFPAVFKAKQEKYNSKLAEMFQKVEDHDSGDRRSCNMSNSSVCDGSQMSPTSVTSVTTDLGLGICSSPTCNKLKKPAVQYTMEPPKEIPSRFSPNNNVADGNMLKHPSQSSSCLSFDYCGQVDAKNPKILFEALSKEVSWQDEALRAIVKTIVCSPTKRVKHRGPNQPGDIWMNFVGHDRLGKKKIAVSLAELLYGSRESFIFVDLSSEEMKGCNVKFRGKTTLDFIVGECCKKPLSVVFLENVDKADILAQNSLSQAIKTGKITDSHGREVSVNNTMFVFSFSDYQNSSMPRGEPSNYSEERILRAKGGGIKIKVEHVIGDIRSQSISLTNNSIDAIPNLNFLSKRKLIGDNEFHDPHLLSDTAKRAHTTSNWLLDLNLPAEENEQKQTNDGNSDHVVSTENQKLWLQDLCDLVDETVVFKPYDFDALADRVLKVIRSNFNKILGSKCALQIQTEVMDQFLAAQYVSDRDTEVENWVEEVLCEGFTEIQRRYNLTASSIVKLATCPEQAAGVHLPSRIILD
ncbi:hypothetical protein JHK87_032065 [Glycine soja]|nr:hypothetical protein JHK87_032065 [Glycine soja]